MKKLATVILIILLIGSSLPPVYPYSQTLDFICENGLSYYRQGRYDEALQEFKKALLVQANYGPALKYIRMIEKEMQRPEETGGSVFEEQQPDESGRLKAMNELFELAQRKMEAGETAPFYAEAKEGAPLARIAGKETAQARRKIFLDESLSKITQPIEIESTRGIILSGKNIQRFLIIEPRVLSAVKKNPDELLVTGKEIGYTYMHVWDDSGRTTLEFLTVPARPEGETLDEKMRRFAERAENFTLSYSMGWSSYEKGRRLDSLERSDYSYTHSLAMKGETPYGNIDSSVSVNRFQKETALGGYTLGLTNGRVGPFKGFTLRGFDFFDFPPSFSNISFPGVGLRGGMVSSPAFNNRLNYTAFYGRENWTGYGNLAPDVNVKRDSFINGINLTYTPAATQDYKFTITHGWGKDRDPDLNSFGYDLSTDLAVDKWKLGYETANDSENFANILAAHYSDSNLRAGLELRDINKNFMSIITGSSWLQGELGALFDINYRPIEQLDSSLTLNVYQDRLYPAQDNKNRLNEEVNWNNTYRLDKLTTFRLDYSLQNDLGILSQYRYQTADLGVSRLVKLFNKDIDTYVNYYHQNNSNYTTPASDYSNERIASGLRFNLIADIYYYASAEINWLSETYAGNRSMPKAFETGLDWSRQLGRSPFYSTLRFTYRDEEDTASQLSFLSGEDYIEGYSQLSYRPSSDMEIYGSCRIRNVWAENPGVLKRIEASFNAGMHYLWDTGVSWQSQGNIEGYVFKDYNSDGMIQRDEAPVAGVKVWLGRNKSAVTDIFGYYKFKGVRGKKAYVTVDTATIPSGFILTTPVTQETFIEQGRSLRLDFGIVARSEISGFIFEDTDASGRYSRVNKGVRGVMVILEDGSKAKTDESGRYSFPHVAPGEHSVTLDLNTLPVYYLPKTAVTKKITLFEGVTYVYNIPLQINK